MEKSKAKIGDQVKVAVTVKLRDGSVALCSTREKPLEFELNPERTIPGFAEALVGMEQGESKSAKVSPEKGFGEYDEKKKLFVERRQLDREQKYAVGDQVTLRSPGTGGRAIQGWIEEIESKQVVINRNHRLAGEELNLEIELLELQQ